MSPRREVLRLLIGGLGVLASCRTAPTASPRGAGCWSRDDERRFLREFRRAGARTYSEEGIPVFLVGEDLVGAAQAPRVSIPGGTGWAAKLSRDVRCAAETVSKAGLVSGEEDVGKVVEVLAERDFGTLWTGARP